MPSQAEVDYQVFWRYLPEILLIIGAMGVVAGIHGLGTTLGFWDRRQP